MKLTTASMLLLFLSTSAGAVAAQPIYRCGAAYSQLPCPHARVVDADDTRSMAQRVEAIRVVDSDRRLAADMRRDRLADEATRRPAGAASLSGTALAAAGQTLPRAQPKSAKKTTRPGARSTPRPKPLVARGAPKLRLPKNPR